ncbi:DUF4145 domain-containing protein [Escherichia coli]|uniref:DUF4145 domain-containing protein n=1 Tax=Escherichia marmotae TaxID=1499973 RepID=A0A7H9KBL6_9ESCH|nr:MULTISPECIES: DUF4145 domain-containing protein [Escherichia]ECD4582991.1 DUF4145 domain-containing protein [Salmonella enterica subsp. enterica serovar Newport]QLV03281.1 DUF4145 domain-containing protein [Escherichia marmotae]WHH28707.1 DUF4145 domain-containing protein [Escherichia coli]WHH83243.1 DUF4145 domain-containing protein [Escherichia coli]
MKKNYHYYGECPKCKNTGKISINEWKEIFHSFHDGKETVKELSHIVSLSIRCNYCNYCSAGSFTYEYDGPSIGENLSIYSDNTGNITDKLLSVLKTIKFDVKIYKENHDLIAQAEKCYEIGVWTAVGMLCRKFIDIRTVELWRKMNIEEICPQKLKQRIDKLFPESDEKHGKAKAYHKAHSVRLDGNTAAHEQETITQEVAKDILEFTKWFHQFTTEEPVRDFGYLEKQH